MTLVTGLLMSQLDALHAAAFPALAAHNACRRGETAQCAVARDRYTRFLAEHPGSPVDVDVKFFFAELLNDNFATTARPPRFTARSRTFRSTGGAGTPRSISCSLCGKSPSGMSPAAR
jgi:hypothetical protein